MSGEAEARVLAAGESFEVNGKTYRLRPVLAQQLCDLERDSLRYYKQQYLTTFAENRALLGEDSQAKIDAEVMRVASWDLSNLPQKNAYDTARLNVGTYVRDPVDDKDKFTPKSAVYQWVQVNYGNVPDTESGVRRLLANALDTGRITPEEVEELTGGKPVVGRVRFDQWWITSSIEGMISFLSSSVYNGDGKRVKEEELKTWPYATLNEAARIVEALTVPDLGNT